MALPERLALTVPEVAAELVLPVSTLYDLIRRGDVPSVRIGKRIRIPRRRLEEWINEKEAV